MPPRVDADDHAAPGDEWGPEDTVGPSAAPSSAPVATVAPPPPAAEPPPPDEEEKELRQREKSADTLIVAGWATGGSGFGLGLVLVGGALILAEISDGRAEDAAEGTTLVERDPEEFRNRSFRRRRFALISSTICGVLVITGATLLGVGYSRRKEAREGLQRKKAERLQSVSVVAPWVAPGAGGLSWQGRF